MWRRMILAASLAGAGCSCSRSDHGGAPGIQILSISTATPTPLPGRVIDVVMLVENTTSYGLEITRAELRSEPEAGGFRAQITADSPTILTKNADTLLRFSVTLPSEPKILVIDGEVAAMTADAAHTYVSRSALSPWSLDQDVQPADTDLVVTTTDDELDGGAGLASVEDAGGPLDLSFREAIVIADNRAGPDLIRFDLGAFPPTGLGIITLDPALGTVHITDDDTVIDGTDRKVVITVDPAQPVNELVTGFLIRIEDASRVIFRQVEVRFACGGLSFSWSTASTVQDCRFARNYACSNNNIGVKAIYSDDFTLVRSTSPDAARAADIVASSRALIADNTFATNFGLDTVTNSTIRNNIIIGTLIIAASFDNLFTDNTVNGSVNYDCVFLRSSSRNRLVANTLLNCGNDSSEAGITLTDGDDNTFSQNSIWNQVTPNSGGIDLAPNTNRGVLAPEILGVGAAITGQRNALDPVSVAGSVVEVFHDAAGLAQVYVGSTTLDSGGQFSLTPAAPIPSGRFVTATITTPTGSTSALATSVLMP